ncbi:hypothetical protein D3C87_38980 [compost metagenome]
MERVILVAHGQRQEGVHSKPNVIIITKAYQPLSFEEAINYMKGANAPEYPSTSVGDMEPLTDANCRALFGAVPVGTGYVFTGKRRGGDMKGYRIFALRGAESNLEQVSAWATQNDFKVILLSCRS